MKHFRFQQFALKIDSTLNQNKEILKTSGQKILKENATILNKKIEDKLQFNPMKFYQGFVDEIQKEKQSMKRINK